MFSAYCLHAHACRPPRPQSLAAEVVALEEQLLQLKSSHLRDKSQASGASEVARVMQVRRMVEVAGMACKRTCMPCLLRPCNAPPSRHRLGLLPACLPVCRRSWRQ